MERTLTLIIPLFTAPSPPSASLYLLSNYYYYSVKRLLKSVEHEFPERLPLKSKGTKEWNFMYLYMNHTPE